MIRAECHSDDRVVEVQFDATKWFEQATSDQVNKLRECGWRGDYPADDVAIFMAEHNDDIADMFKYIELRHKVENIGFECSVDEEHAEKWLLAKAS